MMKIKPYIHIITDFRKLKPGCYVRIKDYAFSYDLIKLNGQIVKVTYVSYNIDFLGYSNIKVCFNDKHNVYIHLENIHLDEN